MDILEILKPLSEGGAWLTLAGVLIWIVKTMMRQADHRDKQHCDERAAQDKEHQESIVHLLAHHANERRDWISASERGADKIARAVSDAIYNAKRL